MFSIPFFIISKVGHNGEMIQVCAKVKIAVLYLLCHLQRLSEMQ